MADATSDQSEEDDEQEQAAQSDRDKAILKAHAGQLLEQFDSVQIICTRDNGTHGTGHNSYGVGNYYARYGSVKAWLVDEEAALTTSSGNED